jgi:hypothetical protein
LPGEANEHTSKGHGVDRVADQCGGFFAPTILFRLKRAPTASAK